MYRHTVTVYDRTYTKIATIKDGLKPSDYGFDQYDYKVKGGPVECAFSHSGKYAWVSNYSMSGGDSTQFVHPGCDNCSGTGKYDSSFLYKVNVATQKVEAIIQVGAVPKYVAASPNNKWVLVTNWSSGDLSIVDASLNKEVKRIKLGTFPRGIVVDHDSKYAYVTVMGSTKLVRVDLDDFSIDFIDDVGKGPRHLCISPDNKWLYLTLNSENKIAKIDLDTWAVTKLKVGHQPRSMTISKDGKHLYLVNYNDNTFSKIETEELKIVAISKTKTHPIGITYDDLKQEVWVACYSGYIQVFKDSCIKRDVEIPLDELLEEEQLLVNADGKASVAHLNGPKKEEVEIVADTVLAQADIIDKTPIRAMLPVRRLYLDFDKTFIYASIPVNESVAEYVEPTEVMKEVVENNTSTLDKSKEYLVVVGSFGQHNNALAMVEIMADEGLGAGHFKNTSKNMNYVFVYATDQLEEAQSWAQSNVPKEFEYWVMHQ